MKLEAAMITNNSPYAEVRSVVSNRDDPEMPCGTIRAWFIGLFFAAILGFINQFFSVRQPAIQLMANVAQLLSFPIGKAWERFMPHATVFGLPLNPGEEMPFPTLSMFLILRDSGPYCIGELADSN